MKLVIVSPYPPEISGVGHYGARLARHNLAALQTMTLEATCATYTRLFRRAAGLDH